MTAYDAIAEANGDDECRHWLRKVINAKDEVVAFVDSRLEGVEPDSSVVLRRAHLISASALDLVIDDREPLFNSQNLGMQFGGSKRS